MAFCFFSFVYVDVGFYLYPVEIAAFLVCIHIILSRSQVRYHRTFSDIYASRVPNLLCVMLGIWLFATLVSDLSNATPTGDMVKGLARVVSLAALLVAILYLVRGDKRRVRLMWWALAWGQIAGLALQPGTYFTGEPWKFGFSLPVTVMVFLLASSAWKRVDVFAAAALGGVHFLLGTRSLAIVCLVAALILLVRRRRAGSINSTRLFVVAGVGLAAVVAVVASFDQLSMRGFFGESGRSRAAYQASGDFGTFLTGRGEIFFSLRSIVEKPLTGVGSYGTPSREVIEAQSSLLIDEGYSAVGQRYFNGGFTSFHSELFGAVAENGIFAFGFWAVVGLMLVRGVRSVLTGASDLAALLSFVCVLGAWDLFFSPFGADRKFLVAASIATILALGRHRWNEAGRSQSEGKQ